MQQFCRDTISLGFVYFRASFPPDWLNRYFEVGTLRLLEPPDLSTQGKGTRRSPHENTPWAAPVESAGDEISLGIPLERLSSCVVIAGHLLISLPCSSQYCWYAACESRYSANVCKMPYFSIPYRCLSRNSLTGFQKSY
jgi:hypothetical protein